MPTWKKIDKDRIKGKKKKVRILGKFYKIFNFPSFLFNSIK